MIIAVNTRLLLKKKLEGIGWFTYETFKRIAQQHPEHQFIFIFDRPFSEEFIFSSNVTPVIIGPQARHPVLFYWWFEFSIKNLLKKLKPDIFVSPDGYLSLSSKVKSLAVMHDLNFAHYPKDLPFIIRKYYNYFFPLFARKAKRIATVSEFSKQDIINQYQISPDKIDVVYNGASELFKPVAENIKHLTKEKYSKGRPYFIYVGSIHPRKNITNLLFAFDEFKRSCPCDVQLLIVGEKYYWTSEMRIAYENTEHREEIIFTGRLYSENLRNVIASALALTYVSYFEGFGIPIIEAMCCDTPVITSNVTSMPEIAGDAALLVDPFSINSIKEAMVRMYKDETLRKGLIEKGKIRRQEFTWQKSADKLWESILMC